MKPSEYISSGIKLKLWCLLLFIAFCKSTLMSQGGFKKKYYLQNSLSSVCANAIETPNGQILALGVTIDTIFGQQTKRLTLVGTDAQGNFLWKKSYGNSSLQYYSNIEQGYVDSTGYYQAVVMQDIGLRAFGGLIKFNFQGDTIWQKIYREQNPFEDLVPTSVTRSFDGGFLITGFFQNWASNDTDKLLLIKTDANGNELWRKKIIGTATNWQNIIWAYGIVEDKDSKRILMSGYQHLGASPTIFSSYGSVFCTDSLGNTLWQKAFSNQGSAALEKVVSLGTDAFMAVGANCTKYDNLGFGKRWQGAVVKFDTAGNLLWNKTYDSESYSNGLRQICKTASNKIFIAGVIDSSSMHTWNGSPVIEVLEINYAGDLIGSKLVGSSQEEVFGTGEMPRSVFFCKDKGFVLATQFPVSSNPQPYGILKLDSNFCDTLEAYCRSVELAVNELQKRGSKFTIFPNPTTSQVTVQLNTDALQKLDVSIYDLCGRRVKQITIEASDTLQISLADLEVGVYSLQVFAQGKSMGLQKLVLQK